MPITKRKDQVLLHMGFSWYCWMWLVAVLWFYVVGCEHCEGCSSSSNLHSAHTLNVAPQYRNQPHPTLAANIPHMQ